VSVHEIERLVAELDALPEGKARETALALVQSVMDLHAEAFARVLEMCDAERLAGDELIGSLLLLYGLHPEPVEQRVEAALEHVRPYLHSHGGSVALASVADGVVHLRLDGSCHGCPSSSRTIKLAVEDAIFEAAPEIRAVVAADVADVPAGRWEAIDLSSLTDFSGRTVDVAGRSLYVCRTGDDVYAWGSACPGCGATLGDAHIDDHAVRCARCGRRFDMRAAGQGVDEPSLRLDPFPLLVEEGQARVALPA
jgi:Fe-S cluster biogenesis protein NfuA/nitrite reductase/ring-hydroxylating ferredoxin subunit